MTEKDLEMLGIGNAMMKKAREMENKIDKRGYGKEDKDYFFKVYEYLKNNNYDTTRLEEKLKDLQLKKTNEKEYGYIGAHYDEDNNRIVYINEEDLYHETFHIATKGITFKYTDPTGKINERAKGLNEGITDLFATKIKEDVPTNYILQMICAKVLEKIYTKDVFIPYFNGSYSQFINQFEDKEEIVKLVEDLDKYHENYTNLGNKKLLSSFFKVLSDLLEMSKNLPKTEFNEIIDIIEQDLEKPQIEFIMSLIKMGRKEEFDIRKEFSLGISRK